MLRSACALHAKLLVFDRSSVYVGSMNFDRRSIWLNTEVGLIIRSPELAEQTARRFAAMTQPQSSYSVTLQQADPPARPRLHWSTVDAGHPVSPWSRLAVPGRDSRCACCRCCRWTASYERAGWLPVRASGSSRRSRANAPAVGVGRIDVVALCARDPLRRTQP